MTDEPLVDTHVHFWDTTRTDLWWTWLQPGSGAGRWGLGQAHDTTYLPDDAREESAGTGLGAVVAVHSSDPIDDPAVETEWLESTAERHGIPQAIVGRCWLARSGAAELLRRHARHPRFRGVRDLSAYDHLDPDGVVPAMEVAGELGITVELRRSHEQLEELRELARRWPEVTITLSHGCLPPVRNRDERVAWSSAVSELARAVPNVVCKVSALAGASEPDWTPASIRPWILAAVDAFGVDRCVLGSNWPVDRAFGTYRHVIDAYREALDELDPGERRAILAGTAERVYGLSAVAAGTPAPSRCR